MQNQARLNIAFTLIMLALLISSVCGQLSSYYALQAQQDQIISMKEELELRAEQIDMLQVYSASTAQTDALTTRLDEIEGRITTAEAK